MTASALGVQRRLTRAFIAQQPVVITLVPRHRDKTSSGGFRYVSEAPRAPQTLTLIEPGGIPELIRTEDGVEREIIYELLGMDDALIGKDDVFTHDGVDWFVARVYPSNGWEQRASVVRLG